MTIAATGPNAEQIEYWNSPSAAKWVAQQDRIDATIEPFGVLAMDRAELAAGERARARARRRHLRGDARAGERAGSLRGYREHRVRERRRADARVRGGRLG